MGTNPDDGDGGRRLPTSRRSVLGALGGVVGAAALSGASIGTDEQGNLTGGAMALSEAFNVAGDLWIGPNAAKSNVTPSEGRVYRASDTEEEYYGDGSSWVAMGFSGPSIETDRQTIGDLHVLGPDESLQTVLDNNAGVTVDLAGRTVEVSSEVKPHDDQTIQNGTLKLADGADADLFSASTNHNGGDRLTVRNVVFDFNGPNNTGGPGGSGNGYVTFHDVENVEITGCDFINNGTRGTGTRSLHFFTYNSRIVNNRVEMDAGDVFINGYGSTITANVFKNNGEIQVDGQDQVMDSNQIIGCAIGLKFRADGGDFSCTGNILEDNDVGITVEGDINADNHITILGGQVQGSTGKGLDVKSGAAVSGRLKVMDVAFKRNQLNQATGKQIHIQDGSLVELRGLSLTNQSGTDASNGIVIEADAEDTMVYHVTALNTDFGGTAIADSGTGTITGDNITS